MATVAEKTGEVVGSQGSACLGDGEANDQSGMGIELRVKKTTGSVISERCLAFLEYFSRRWRFFPFVHPEDRERVSKAHRPGQDKTRAPLQ